MAIKFQQDICQLGGLLPDEEEEEVKLHQRAPVEEDLESNASTDTVSNTLKSEFGEDSDCEYATFASLFSMNETLVIIDWDDTVLPTTWLQRESLIPQQSVHGRLSRHYQHELTMEQQGQLRALADSVERTLRVAKENGTLVIITNGSEGWVQYSCMKYLPTLVPLLHDVKIVSARSIYEPSGHTQDMWKCLVFQDVIKNFYGTHFRGKQRNVLSLGDSMHEHKALLYATNGIPNCRAKFLKFSECPDVEHLTEEHELLSECLHWAIHHDDDLDLEIAEESSV